MIVNKAELITNILINVLFVSLFIALFFFTYAAYIEKQVVTNQMKFLAGDTSNIIKLFGKNVTEIVRDNVKNTVIPDLSHEDEIVKKSNNEIIKKVIKINIFFAIIVSLIVYYIYIKYSNKSYDLGEIIVNNLIILFFIGIVEYSILKYFGSRYISIDTNKVKLSLLTNFKKYNYI
uniref:Uncharacterized protein n=1 Tax=viral metagenome TaxID=1070528 RepID=A0A6C0DD17_9ZZZZ